MEFQPVNSLINNFLNMSSTTPTLISSPMNNTMRCGMLWNAAKESMRSHLYGVCESNQCSIGLKNILNFSNNKNDCSFVFNLDDLKSEIKILEDNYFFEMSNEVGRFQAFTDDKDFFKSKWEFSQKESVDFFGISLVYLKKTNGLFKVERKLGDTFAIDFSDDNISFTGECKLGENKIACKVRNDSITGWIYGNVVSAILSEGKDENGRKTYNLNIDTIPFLPFSYARNVGNFSLSFDSEKEEFIAKGELKALSYFNSVLEPSYLKGEAIGKSTNLVNDTGFSKTTSIQFGLEGHPKEHIILGYDKHDSTQKLSFELMDHKNDSIFSIKAAMEETEKATTYQGQFQAGEVEMEGKVKFSLKPAQ